MDTSIKLFFYTSFFLAWKSIVRNKKKVFLTLLIVSLGFISSIIIYGVLKDTAYDLEQDFIDTYFGHIFLEPYDSHEQINNVQNIMDKIEILPEVVGVTSINRFPARLYDSKGNYIDKEIWAVDPEKYSKTSSVESLTFEGDYLEKGDKDKIFIGCLNLKSCSNFADSMPNIDASVGDKISIKLNTGETGEFYIKGNYKHNFDTVADITLITEESAEQISKNYDKNQADMILIRLSDRELTQEVIEEISFLGINAKIIGWEDKLSFYSGIIESFDVVGNLSFLIGVVISAISVYVILHINILNKKVQIGIMRAIGIRSKIISFSYTLQGFFYGVFGSVFGIIFTFMIIGYFKINPIASSIGELVPKVTSEIFMLVASAIIVASTLTGYFVSRKIVKLNIIESIANE